MNAKLILCPVDFSDSSNAAVQYAAALTRDSGGRLILLHVVENPLAYDSTFSIPSPTEKELEDDERHFHAIRPNLPDNACEHRSVQGDPAASIVRVAKEEQVDLIVVGTHGRTGLARMVMGSVAELVVRRAHCPVIAVKQPSAVAEPMV